MKRHRLMLQLVIGAMLARVGIANAATLTVMNENDDGAGSLRQAISDAAIGDTIVFDVSVGLINVFSQLWVNKPLIIDGGGDVIVTSGVNINLFFISATGSNSTIKNLAVTRGQCAFYIQSTDNVQILNCRIGTDWSNASGKGPQTAGIYVNGGKNIRIEGNIIAGCATGAGIHLDNAHQDALIRSNRIGTDSTGNATLANMHGIRLSNGVQNTLIGGNFSTDRNQISGNTMANILMEGAMTSGNTICGNNIGLNASLLGSFANLNGILIQSPGNFVGLQGDQFNIIGDHAGNGVWLSGTSCRDNVIQNNCLGYVPGSTAHPNVTGVFLDAGASNNRVGRYTPGMGDGNLISFSTNGIRVSGAMTMKNTFFSNTITAFSGEGIGLEAGGNINKPRPVILSADLSLVSGTTSAINDTIEIFLAERGTGMAGGSLKHLGTVSSGAMTDWSWVPAGVTGGDIICALATDQAGNTSPFSFNVLVLDSTPTVTRTYTRTMTSSPTFTRTFTPVATSILTFTPTPTSTRTPSPGFTSTPTGTRTPSLTMTVTHTLTRTPIFTGTPSASTTATPTCTGTPWFDPTTTLSPSSTRTPTISNTAYMTFTPTVTLTPTITSTVHLTTSPTSTRTSTAPINQDITGTPTRTSTPNPTPILTNTPVPIDGVTPPGTPSAGIEVWPNDVVRRSFPNPVRRGGTVTLSLFWPRDGHGRIWLCDFNGRTVVTLLDADVRTGPEQVQWRAENQGRPLAPGVYTLIVQIADRHEKKPIVVRP